MKLLPAVAVVILVSLVAGRASAAPPPASVIESTPPLPAALTKPAPESVAELKAIQDQVKAALKKAMPATVAIALPDPSGRGGVAAGSGVIISEDGYVLTAGHISMKPGETCSIRLPDGKRVKGETLGWNKSRDAGLIKITDSGKWPFVKMADSDKAKVGDWCLTVGHPGGYKPGRPPVVRLGRLLAVARDRNQWIQTDTPLVGGDSGGPLFDLNGNVLGIHSWISQAITGNMHVPVNVYKETWDRLAKGEEWGREIGGGRAPAYLGVSFDRETEDLKITDVTPGAPADKAGLKPGDVIVSVDDRAMTRRQQLLSLLSRKRPGNTVTITVEREGKKTQFEVRLAARDDD
jgi:serine protease Do